MAATPYLLIPEDQFQQMQSKGETSNKRRTSAQNMEFSDDESVGKFDRDRIESQFETKEVKRYIGPILNAMERSPKILNYDAASGNLMFKAREIKGSNIIHLLRDTLTGDINPVGKMGFYQGLSRLGVDKKYIRSRKNKAFLEKISMNKKRKAKQQETKQKSELVKKGEWIPWP